MRSIKCPDKNNTVHLIIALTLGLTKLPSKKMNSFITFNTQSIIRFYVHTHDSTIDNRMYIEAVMSDILNLSQSRNL